MKTSTYLLLLAGFIPCGLKAQDERTAIQQWQSLHPTTLLISSERFNSMSEDERALLGNNYIVFQEKITIAQLQQYDAEKEKTTGVAQKQPLAKDEDLQFIKNWRATHREVRIVPHSKYITLNEVRLQQVQSSEFIILEGETITVKDIEHYKALYGE